MTEKNRHLKILTVAIGVLTSMAILESSLRLFKYELLPFVGMTHNPCILIENQQTGYRYKKNSTGWLHRNFEMDNIVEINSDGFHDLERNSASGRNNRKSILAVGDSFTASIHVPVVETWTQVLERQLRTISVVNLGLSGTATDVHLTIMKEYLSVYQPEVVILAFYENDIRNLNLRKRYNDCYKGYVLYYHDQDQKERLKRYVGENHPDFISRWLYDKSLTFRLASHFLHPGYQLLKTNKISPNSIGLKESEEPVPHRDIDELLIEFKQLSEQRAFRLLVIPVPTRESPTGSLDEIRAAAASQVLAGLEVVDISPIMKSLREAQGEQYSNLFWRFDGHFNSKGNELFGLAVAKIVAQRITDE